MTQKELEQYANLNKKFFDKCFEIVKILNKYSIYSEQKVILASDFHIVNNLISWNGSEDVWGKTENYSGCFPSRFLTMSNDNIELQIAEENTKYMKKLEKDKQDRINIKEKLEYKHYLELKKKYESE